MRGTGTARLNVLVPKASIGARPQGRPYVSVQDVRLHIFVFLELCWKHLEL